MGSRRTDTMLRQALIDLRRMTVELAPPGTATATARPLSNCGFTSRVLSDFEKCCCVLRAQLDVAAADAARVQELRGDESKAVDRIRLESRNGQVLDAADRELSRLLRAWERGSKVDKVMPSKRTAALHARFAEQGRVLEQLRKYLAACRQRQSGKPAVVERADVGGRNKRRRQQRLEARRLASREVKLDVLGAAQPGAQTQQEVEFEQQVYANVAKEDEVLSQISKGLDELAAQAQDFKAGLALQNVLVEEVDAKMSSATDRLVTSNVKLKNMLADQGGVETWCPRLVCFLLLVSLVGFIFQTIPM